MREYLFSKGDKRNLTSGYRLIQGFLIGLTALYIVLASFIYPEPLLHRSLSFGLFFAIIFLSYTSPGSHSKDSVPFYDICLALLALSVSAYFAVNIDRIINRFVFVTPLLPIDLFFGILTILLLLEGTRRVIGPWLTMISLFSILYMLSGHLIPGRFGHNGFTFSQTIEGLFMTNYAIWGSTIGTATGHVIIILMFGAFFVRSGAGDFLFDFASSVAGSTKGGLAKVAIITSALFGMISGGPVSNVSTTGSVTIPAMKKRGYSGEFAAAVECCASIGGVFTPPIMGSIAFIMSDVVGIPYREVAKGALMPAILYFSALFFTISIKSDKLNLPGLPLEDRKPLLPLLKSGYNFFIPLGFLIFRMMSGVSIAMVGIQSILIVLVLTLFNKRHRLTPRKFYGAVRSAVEKGLVLVATMGTCGIFIGVIHITGISSKFSSFLMDLTSFSIILTLVFVMLITVFIGTSTSGSSAYLLTAVICAPVLIRFGFEPLSVHMFILYYATTATITPPVAITAFTAATIADVSSLKVSILAIKIGLVAYILPYVFIFNPSILMANSNLQSAITFVFAFIGIYWITIGKEGWWHHTGLNAFERIAVVISGVLVMSSNITLKGAAMSMIILLYLFNRNKTVTNKDYDILEEKR
ncbi:MAG: TRAP transporter fused permease subunit [Eubacteriales bacterium]|nr:TRAP transporter fused permease subunit [Eubacteriales bacterium]